MVRYLELINRLLDSDGGPGGGGGAAPSQPVPLALPIFIGSSSKARIRLPEREGKDGAPIPGEVAVIGEADGHLFLQPLTRRVEIFHNNRAINRMASSFPEDRAHEGKERQPGGPGLESVWIKSGDTIRIGGFLIRFSISGDLLCIEVDRAGQGPSGRNASMPEGVDGPAPFLEGAATEGIGPGKDTLPRVDAPASRGGRPAFLIPALLLVSLLGVAAAFLLAARAFTIHVEPEPDQLSVEGIFPVIELGGRFLALPGTYTVHALKEEYLPLKEEIEIASGVKEFRLSMKPLPGLVDITTKPAGARIVVDGTDLGMSPLSGLELDAGLHGLYIEKERFRPVKEQIEILGKGRHQRFSFGLEPLWAQLHISSKPPGADLVLDGERIGVQTPCSIEVLEGRHQLSLTLPGFETAALDIEVSAGQETTLPTVELKPAPAHIEIVTRPAGALVAVDGTYVGKSPVDVELAPGRRHEITLTAPGYRDEKRMIEPRAGERRRIEIGLSARYATLFVSTSPKTARLFLDGRPQARNSGRFRLLARTHTIEARAPGFAPFKKEIALVPDGSQALDIRLEPRGSVKKAASKAGLGNSHEMVLISPGSFLMGSSRREQGRRTNEIQRQVTLTKPYLISKKEVTNREFRRFKRAHSSGSFQGRSLDGDDQPVVNVSWEDAVRYCNWLSEQEGLRPFYREEGGRFVVPDPNGPGYRLPTEAEWAYAARAAGRARPARYPWGSGYPPRDRAGNFADESARGLLPVIIEGYRDSFPVSAPAGSFSPNPAGLFDMGGNVSEWCHDYYSPTARPGPVQDPMGPERGTHHVVRDSSWQDSSITELRLAYRSFSRKGSDFIGFRVARYAK